MHEYILFFVKYIQLCSCFGIVQNSLDFVFIFKILNLNFFLLSKELLDTLCLCVFEYITPQLQETLSNFAIKIVA